MRFVFVYIATTCLCAEMSETNPITAKAEVTKINNLPANVLELDAEFINANTDELKAKLQQLNLKDGVQKHKLNRSNFVEISISRRNGDKSFVIHESRFDTLVDGNFAEDRLREYAEKLKTQYTVKKPEKTLGYRTSLWNDRISSHTGVFYKGIEYEMIIRHVTVFNWDQYKSYYNMDT